MAVALQEAGNALFVDENYDEALQKYSQSLELDALNVETFLKRSICHYKLENYTEALSDATSALKLQPNNTKAFLRKGMACFALGEFESAQSAFEKGIELDPSNSTFKTWIRKCKAELESEGGEEETVNTPKTVTQEIDKQQPPKTENAVPSVPKIRHEWYQNPTHVYVSLFVKNVKKENVTVDTTEKTLSVAIHLSESNEFQLNLDLCGSIVPQETVTQILSTKIEIKLKKAISQRWGTLESTGQDAVTPWSATTSGGTQPTKKNWDKIVDEEIKGEPLDGEDSLNKVFQDIYSNGSEEQKRAMLKSFLESGGTVLSTNWDEVGKGEVKGSPPEGMEMKKWNEL